LKEEIEKKIKLKKEPKNYTGQLEINCHISNSENEIKITPWKENENKNKNKNMKHNFQPT
jgi:hypothetical protein